MNKKPNMQLEFEASENSKKEIYISGEWGYYVPTNRANILEILSCGLILPRIAYEKYKTDLGKLCPNMILLIKGPVPRNLDSILSINSNHPFPVMLEVDISDQSLKHYSAIKISCFVDKVEENSTIDNTIFLIASESLPATHIKAIHFRNEEEKEDYLAREFPNVPHDYCPVIVTPALFEGNTVEKSAMLDAFSKFKQKTSSIRNQYLVADSIGGMLALISKTMPASSSWLNCIMDSVKYSLTGDYKYKYNTETFPIDYLIYNTQLNNIPDTKNINLDERLLRSAIILLRKKSPSDGWVPLEVLQDICNGVNRAKLCKKEQDELDQWKLYVEKILNNEVEAKKLSDEGSLIRRSLLLLLLRPEPESVLSSKKSSLSPEAKVLTCGAALSGLYYGYARMPIECKGDKETQSIISRIKSIYLNINLITDYRFTWDVDEKPTMSVQSLDGLEKYVSIQVFGHPLIIRKISPNPSMMKLYFMAKEIGYDLEYNHDLQTFIFRFEFAGGRFQNVIIKQGKNNDKGQKTVRFISQCMYIGGENIKKLTREVAIDLLSRNDHMDMYCRFALNSELCALTVEVDQIIDTMDQAELIQHMQLVAKKADEYEKEVLNTDKY